MAVLDIAWQHIRWLCSERMEEDRTFKKICRTVKTLTKAWIEGIPTMLQLYVLLRMDGVCYFLCRTYMIRCLLINSISGQVFEYLDETISKSLPGSPAATAATTAIEAEGPSIRALRAGQILCALTHLLQFVFLYGQPDCELCSPKSNMYTSSTLVDTVFGLCPRFAQERKSLKWYLAIGYTGLSPSATAGTYILENETSLEPILHPSRCSNVKEFLEANGRWIAVTDFVDNRIVHIDCNIDLLQELSSEREEWEEEGGEQQEQEEQEEQKEVQTGRTPVIPGIRTGPELQDKYSRFLREFMSPPSPSFQHTEEQFCPHRVFTPFEGPDIARYIGGQRGSISFDKYYYTLLEYSGLLKRTRDFPRKSGPRRLLETELQDIDSMLNGYKTYQPQTALPKGVSSFIPTDQGDKVAEMVADVLFQLNDMQRGSYLRQAYLSLCVLTSCQKLPQNICSQVFIKNSGWGFIFEKLPEDLPANNKGKRTGPSWVLVRCIPLRLSPPGVEGEEVADISCFCVQDIQIPGSD